MTRQILLKSLVPLLLAETRLYGVKEVSMEQYSAVCSRFLDYAALKGVDTYSKNLIDDYLSAAEIRCERGEICPEYLRFHKRVMRMITSLASTGKVDFSTSYRGKKYKVSECNLLLIESILTENNLKGETRTEMETVMRHFFSFAESKDMDVESLNDDLFMEFLTSIIPITNSGSIGRTFRGVRFVSVYLRKHQLSNITTDFSLLKVKTNSAKIVPPFSQKEILRMLEAIDLTTTEGMRDYAIMLLGFNTGLRGVDIRNLRLCDFDWRKNILKVLQRKTSTPLFLPLDGKVMNAIADYILHARPDCEFEEVFLTVKAPIRPLDRRVFQFSPIIRKYGDKAGIGSIPLRGFHSLRRSFATELSMAGVPIETISQLLGHRRLEECRPYLSYDRTQISFCSMGFEETPLTTGTYAGLIAPVPPSLGGVHP